MSDDPPPLTRRLARRHYLAAVGGLTGLAGCGGRSTPTETRTADTASATQTASATPSPTRTATATETDTDTETETEPPTTVVFDGGGAAAFAEALATLRETAADTLRIAPGEYRLDASEAPAYDYPRDDDRVHFDGTGLDGVTIAGPPPEADGTAEIRLTDPTRGFLSFQNPAGAVATDRPRGPTVRDLTVRHDPVPHTQGEIVSLADGGRTITLALEAGLPTFDDPPFDAAHEPDVVWGTVFDADGRRVRRVTGDARGNVKEIARSESLGGRRVRLRLADGIETGGLATGRRLAVVAWHGNASVFNHADRLAPTYERVRLQTSPYRGFNFNACRRPTVRDCEVTAVDGSLVSTNADVIHCNNCPAGPRVRDNLIERNQDDAVVADTELLAVETVETPRRVRVFAGFGTRVGAGDRLVAATARLERLGSLPPVASVDERGGPSTTEPVNPETITFAEPLPDAVGEGTVLTGGRMRNADTVVRGNTIREVRARYVRSGGTDGLVIANNRFVGTHGDGIEVEARGNTGPGVSDLKGWSDDVTIRDNEIAATGLVGVPSGLPRAIHVGVDAGETVDEPSVSGRPHRNVTVTDNDVRESAAAAVEIADTRGVEISNNRIVDPGRIPGIDIGAYGLALRNVADTTVTDTSVIATADDLNGFGWRTGSESVTTSGNEYRVAGEARTPTLTRLDR